MKRRKVVSTNVNKFAQINTTVPTLLQKEKLIILKNEKIAFGSPAELMDKFDQLEQSNLCLIEKNQENQDKCFAIAKKLRETCQEKQAKLEKLKMNKAFLTETINNNTKMIDEYMNNEVKDAKSVSKVSLCKMVLRTLNGSLNESFGKQTTKRIKEQAIVKLAEAEADLLNFEKFIKVTDKEAVNKLMVEICYT